MSLDRFTELAGGLDHPEGVAWSPPGHVIAGGEAGQVYRIGLDGSVERIAATGGFIYGVALDADGNIYACDFGNASVARISPDAELSTYSTGTPERPMRVPNFAAFDDEGNLFVTDSGTGAWTTTRSSESRPVGRRPSGRASLGGTRTAVASPPTADRSS